MFVSATGVTIVTSSNTWRIGERNIRVRLQPLPCFLGGSAIFQCGNLIETLECAGCDGKDGGEVTGCTRTLVGLFACSDDVS